MVAVEPSKYEGGYTRRTNIPGTRHRTRHRHDLLVGFAPAARLSCVALHVHVQRDAVACRGGGQGGHVGLVVHEDAHRDTTAPVTATTTATTTATAICWSGGGHGAETVDLNRRDDLVRQEDVFALPQCGDIGRAGAWGTRVEVSVCEVLQYTHTINGRVRRSADLDSHLRCIGRHLRLRHSLTAHSVRLNAVIVAGQYP